MIGNQDNQGYAMTRDEYADAFAFVADVFPGATIIEIRKVTNED